MSFRLCSQATGVTHRVGPTQPTPWFQEGAGERKRIIIQLKLLNQRMVVTRI